VTGAVVSDRHQRRQDKGARWTGRTRGGYIGNYIFVTLVRHLGILFAYALLVPVALYFLFFAPKALKASDEYRRRLGFGVDCVLSRIWYAYRHFYSFGQILLDRIAIIGGNSSRFRYRFDGEEHLRNALAEGKGLLIISAHCGNWEIAAQLLDRLETPVSIVAYEGEVAYIRNFFSEVFKDRTFSLIEVDGSERTSLAILDSLSRGEVVTMHADRVLNPDRQNTVTVPFLGAPAAFPSGPYYVAAVSGAPLVHAFTMRERSYYYHLYAYPPEHLSLGRRAERRSQLEGWVRRFAGRLEDTLRKYPLQWHNFYSFWDSPASVA
jgi:predicted LPLAT superfamily acyltransferase